MNRRDFLTSSAAALGLASAARTLPLAAAEAPAPKPQRGLKKAMMYGTIGIKGSVLDRFQALKAAGFDGVEANSHMAVDEVLRARDATGLTICSVCCSTHWGKPLSSADPAVREAGVEGIRRALLDAKAYGAGSVLVVPGVAKDGVTYEQCWERSITEIRKLIPVAEDCGAKMAMENVWNDFILDEKEAVRYVDEIASPWVGWHFDTGNIIYYGDPIAWIRALGKRIVRVHIKEYSRDLAMRKDKWAGFGVKLMEGANNWTGIMKALDEIGYAPWIISEQPGDQTKDMDGLRDFAARMDRIIAS